MLKKIGEWMINVLVNPYNNCYKDMEYLGIAAMGCCSGAVGGTSATEYLSEQCVGCPYFVLVKKRDKYE